VAPALREAARLPPFNDGRVALSGPIPAETAFRIASRGELDGVVAMLHDQATIASKLLDWGDAVNVTWGLPFVRTSVDHGVAYAAAESGDIDHAGMDAALALAQQLTQS
jgi:4-hydroxythreonine-4-phosphate dehydrogenase